MLVLLENYHDIISCDLNESSVKVFIDEKMESSYFFKLFGKLLDEKDFLEH